ncbi:MAG: hypothetical protein CMA40_00235 [Euryarchaeota archaeon]|nr:hypothetical protein [Euryarchaeota archaeon]
MGWTCPLCLGAACESGRRSVESRGRTVFELHVLGTSSARFAHGRSVSGSVLNTPGGMALIDCGEGMQKRIIDHNRALKSSGSQHRTRLSRTRVVFLTHGHLDHTWGLLPLLQTLDLDGRRTPLVVMGPSTREAIDWATQHPGESPPEDSGISSTDLAILFSQWQMIGTKDHDSSYPIDWVLLPLEDDQPFKSPIQPLEGVTVTIVPTHHGVPSCGYHFQTHAKQGKFDKLRAENLGLSKRQIGDLAEGRDVTHEGEHLSADSFRGKPRPGCSLMVSGDTAYGPMGFSEEALPSPPQLLLHEATFLADKQDKATEYFHSTAADAARHASACKASALALTHYSSRIERLSPLVSEARRLFSGSVSATLDGDWFEVHPSEIFHHVRVDDCWNTMKL